jgi:hypothetical protein
MSFIFKSAASMPTTNIIPPKPPDEKGDNDNNANGRKEIISFRDKVLGNQILMEREKVDLLATNKAKVELVQGNRLMPMLHVENSVIAELSLPWKDALVVKLLGKSLGYNTMKAKLELVWKLTGGFELMDVGNSYYMVKFNEVEDKNKVINGGPWIIYDHILAVSQWTPTFNAATATIDKTMVWIRIPSLNLVYYDESLLLALASMVGTPVKVDLHTLKVARGRFARMCVEIDLTKPVVGRVGINGDWYHVQYEGLHIICTHCGCYGHVLKDCAMKSNSVPVEKKKNSGENDGGGGGVTVTGERMVEKQNVNQGVINDVIPSNSFESVENITPDLLHGEWIKVERRKKNKKVNFSGYNGQPMSGNSQHSKNTILNTVEKLNREYPIHKGNVNEFVSSSSRNKNWYKKKRPRNDSIGPEKSRPIDTQGIHNPKPYEV